MCQCPLGLIPHFYVTIGSALISAMIACQCPLGLIPHFYCIEFGIVYYKYSVSMPSRAYTSFLRCCTVDPIRVINCVSMPSRAYTSFLRGIWQSNDTLCTVSMPSRAYTSFLRYPFKNLGFMRFPEPVFAGIYQNILTTAIFRAC